MQEVRESKDLSFSAEEERTLLFWEEIDAFQVQLKRRQGSKPYSFYDGPPFATGLPHYGHLLAGTIKVGSCPVLCAWHVSKLLRALLSMC